MATNETTIVRFNVGGVKYEVSRSLIEAYPSTMLARLVSDTWQQDLGSEIFIDRNGQRFQYVLDYMRDQEINLPLNTTKGSAVKELEYFGFEHVDPEAIKSSCANLAAFKHVSMCQKQHEAAFKELELQAKEVEDMKECTIIAHACAKRIGEGDSLSTIWITEADDAAAYAAASSFLFVEEKRKCLDQCLSKYNLKYVEIKYVENRFSVGKQHLYISLKEKVEDIA